MLGFIIMMVLIFAIAVYWINKTTAAAAKSGRSRDRVRLPADERVLGTIHAWAARNDYSLVEETSEVRTYRTKMPLTGAPVFLRVERMDDQFELQSWAVATGLGMSGELALAAPGIALSWPRKEARKPHNELRSELGLPALG
jgi:hypothetical protein